MSVLRKIPWLLAAVLLFAGCVQDSTAEYLVGPQGDVIIADMQDDPKLREFRADERELNLLLARSSVHVDSAFLADEYTAGFDFASEDAAAILRRGGFVQPERMVELELSRRSYYRYLVTQYHSRVYTLPEHERLATLAYVDKLGAESEFQLADGEYQTAITDELKKIFDVPE